MKKSAATYMHQHTVHAGPRELLYVFLRFDIGASLPSTMQSMHQHILLWIQAQSAGILLSFSTKHIIQYVPRLPRCVGAAET